MHCSFVSHYRLQKNLVPLVLESNYSPDGWLGFVCGSNLLYDMYDENCMEPTIGKIFLELKHVRKKYGKYTKPSSASAKVTTSYAHCASGE